LSIACVAALVAVGISASAAAASTNDRYKLTRLVSDRAGVALHQDQNLVNAWGLAAGPSTPWWVANNGTDTSTLYDGTGTPIPLVVEVRGAPTGTVFNGGSGFVVHSGSDAGPALFLFSTESGTIRGWNPNVPQPAPSTRTFKLVDNSDDGAIYKGLAIASTNGHGKRLYATDFHNGRVDMFDRKARPVHIAGAFEDPNLPAGYAPFGIQAFGTKVVVTYAKQDADAEDDVQGAGFGYVDMFTRRGAFIARVASGGVLNAPWGLAWAPSGFGAFSGDLLIGNFGDGTIHAFHRVNGHWQLHGTIHRRNGNTMAIDGLWAIEFGNDAAAGSSRTLYFTAGPNDERHGLFGMIEARP
jgi:uncharacterized protein (TIGR03118 family)